MSKHLPEKLQYPHPGRAAHVPGELSATLQEGHIVGELRHVPSASHGVQPAFTQLCELPPYRKHGKHCSLFFEAEIQVALKLHQEQPEFKVHVSLVFPAHFSFDIMFALLVLQIVEG